MARRVHDKVRAVKAHSKGHGLRRSRSTTATGGAGKAGPSNPRRGFSGAQRSRSTTTEAFCAGSAGERELEGLKRSVQGLEQTVAVQGERVVALERALGIL